MKKFIQIFFGPSLLLAISSLLSRLLGVYRDHLFAKVFGAGTDLDAYYAAFRIPDLLYSLLILASISVVFLPEFQRFKENKKWNEAWEFTSSLINSLLLLFGFISIFIIIIAPILTQIYVPNFTVEQKDLTITMMRIMMISPFFFMLSSVMIAVENAFQKFLAQAIAPILYNLCIIGSIFFFSDSIGVKGLAIGVSVGALLQMLIQIPFLLKTGFKWSPIILKGKELKRMLTIVLPRILSVSADQIALTVSTFLSSSMLAGSLTLLNLAINIQSLPFGMISISISITSFAMLTKFSATNNKEKFQETLKNSFEKTLFFLIPAIFGLFVIVKPLTIFLFEYGEFSVKNIDELVSIINILLLALFAQGLIPLLSRSFFAYQKTWIVFFITLLGLIGNIITSIIFSPKLGVIGLAYGIFVGLSLNATMLLIIALKQYGKFFSILKIFIIFILSIIMYFLLIEYLMPFISGYNGLYQIILPIIIGGSGYLLVASHLLSKKQYLFKN